MPDAMEALRQNMQQEASDELIGVQRHHAIARGTVAAIIFVAESDAALIERDQPAVPCLLLSPGGAPSSLFLLELCPICPMTQIVDYLWIKNLP
jgi:hypothetical protein